MADRRNMVAERIRQRIISGLHLGTLTPGARLPSTREIADEFGVAPRTALSSYRLLEAEGLVELRERSGIYVAPGGGGTTMLTQLAGWVVDILLDARSREIRPIALPERVRRCLETLRLRAVCVVGNADQAEQICDELRGDYGIEAEGIDDRQLSSPDADTQAILTRADLLVTTAIHATQVQHASRRLGKPMITVALRQELMAEFTRQLGDGPVYVVASDPRFRDAVRILLGPRAADAKLRVLILGEDDVESLPPGVPAYIMGRAHRLLGDSALARRLVPIQRVFSREMARDLLTFVVRANIAAMSGRAG